MAKLHRFQDIAKDPKSRAKPIPARLMDENWEVCRTDIHDSLKAVLVREENFPNADKIALAVKSGNYVVWIQNGTAVLLAVPASGTKVLGSIDGVVQWFDTEDC